MFRRTKILATLGPATDDPKVLDKVIEAGVDVVRINFRMVPLRTPVQSRKTTLQSPFFWASGGVLVDLQGPKIRIDAFVTVQSN